ncbi:MAG: stage V sporulation T C-terminal domain-containing protein [Bacilli bacterium]
MYFMNTTGVIRKIDDLGRIVIPKEIRKTLKIRNGESLEIFIDKDMVALKRYHPMDELKIMASTLVESIYQTSNKSIFITDRDKFIACPDCLKKTYLNKPISNLLESLIEEGSPLANKDVEKIELINGNIIKGSYAAYPIMEEQGLVGLVIITSDIKLTDGDTNIAQITAIFLGKHIEE